MPSAARSTEGPDLPLTKAEFLSLVGLVKDVELRDLIAFTVATMMRRGEVVNPEWSDVDFEKGSILLRSKADFTMKGLR
jgi:integrase